MAECVGDGGAMDTPMAAHASNSVRQPAFVLHKARPGQTMYTPRKVRQNPLRTIPTSDAVVRIA